MIARASLFLVLALAGCSYFEEPLPASSRTVLAIPEHQTIGTFALSPDGRWLVYAAESAADHRRRIFVRSLEDGGGAERELPGTLGGLHPFFSPDASSVAYFARGALWRVPASGSGAPQRIVETTLEPAGGTWTADGRIVFAPLGNQGLVQVPAAGGPVSTLTTLNARELEVEHGWPHALPDGEIVFTVSQRGRDPHPEVLSADGTRTRLRVPVAGQAEFVETDHLVYSYLGNLMAVRLDASENRIVGVPVAIAKGVQTGSGVGLLGRAGFAVSRTGTLVWIRAGRDDARSTLVRVERQGTQTRYAVPPEMYQTPRLSPDGRRLAVSVRSGIMTREIRVLDAANPERVVLTLSGGDNQSPAWMDNRRLSFGSNRDGPQRIYTVAVDGKQPPRPLFTADVAVARNPAAWSRPPRLLAFYEIDPGRRRDVLVYMVGKAVVPMAATVANERAPSLSPDGRWIAFASDQSGQDEVYIKPVAEPSRDAILVSRNGGTEPLWTGEGLVYRRGDQFVLVPIADGTAEAEQVVLEGRFERDPGANLAAYDVDRQGRFFIVLKSLLATRELRVVRNWGTELVAQLGRP